MIKGFLSTGYQPMRIGSGIGLIWVVTLLVFAPVLWNGFVWDDHLIVSTVAAYRQFDLGTMLGSAANTLEYLPVRDLTLALDFALWGERPWGFHLSNLLYYLLTLPLLWRVVQRLAHHCGDPDPAFIAFWTTLLFALHPLHVEPVSFITGRNNILALLLLLAAFDRLLDLVGGRMSRLPLLWGLFLLALLAKAHAVFFPLFVLLLALLLPGLQRRGRWILIAVMPLFAIDALAITLHTAIAGNSGLVDPDVWRFGNQNLWINLARAVQIPFFYLGKFIWPMPLSVFYPEELLANAFGWRAAAAVAGLVTLLLCAWFLRRRSLLPLLGMLWFGVALGPVSNLIPNSPVLADRYLYPGLLGLALIVAWALRELVARDRRAVWVGTLLLIAWGGLSFERGFEWRDDRALFASAWAAYPDSSRNPYANALFESGEQTMALALYSGREEWDFHYHYYRGRQLEQSGDLAAAIIAYRRSLALGADAEKWGHLALARALHKAGDTDAALHHYLMVADAGGLDPMARYQRAARQGLEQLRPARDPDRHRLEAAVAANPQRFEAHYALGYLHHTLGNYAAAEVSYLEAVRIAPQRWEPWYNLGLVRGRVGRTKAALEAFAQVLERRPRDLQTLNHMAIESASIGDETRAIGYYLTALEADPYFAEAAYNLGRLYFRRGEHDPAMRYFVQARNTTRNPALVARIDRAIGLLK